MAEDTEGAWEGLRPGHSLLLPSQGRCLGDWRYGNRGGVRRRREGGGR
jgi:hypothetical protein